MSNYTLNRIKSNRKLSLLRFKRDMKRWGVLEKEKQHTSNEIKWRLEKLIDEANNNSMPDSMKSMFDSPYQIVEVTDSLHPERNGVYKSMEKVNRAECDFVKNMFNIK